MTKIPEILHNKILFDTNIVYHDHPVAPVTIMVTSGEVSWCRFCVGWQKMWRNLEGDRTHVVILVFLYCLQGIPLGDVTTVLSPQ